MGSYPVLLKQARIWLSNVYLMSLSGLTRHAFDPVLKYWCKIFLTQVGEVDRHVKVT